ncbi:hypothetical protein K8I31_07755 [bacterium]|nr:hypothetical protein [bacterium]
MSDSVSYRVLVPSCIGGSLLYGAVNAPVVYVFVNHALMIRYSPFQSMCLSLTHSSCLFLSFAFIFVYILRSQISGILNAFMMAVFFWFISSLLFGYSFSYFHPGVQNFLYGILLFFVLNVVDMAFAFLTILLYIIIDALVKKFKKATKRLQDAREE